MRDAVARLWPEIQWIEKPKLREQVTQTWIKALERSPLKPDDLNRIPFTLLVPNCPITFMEHKRCVVHIARQSAESMHEFMGRALPINMDVVIAGAILADVGKLLDDLQQRAGVNVILPFMYTHGAVRAGLPAGLVFVSMVAA